MNSEIACAVIWIWFAGSLLGQSAPSVRPFEAASVRPHEGPLRIMGTSIKGQRLNSTDYIRGFIMYAYNLKNYQIEGPGQSNPIGNVAYDIVAKAEGEAEPTKAEFRQMLQLLLADRFKLQVHWEKREMPVYALVVGKNGPKLKESAADATPFGNLSVKGRNYEVTLTKADMDTIVGGVANSFPDRPVVDRTGLTGSYDVKLVYTPDVPSNRRGEPDPSDISIFTAVQELGLKLEPQKATIEVLVIDHAEKPSEN
ncbi:MAG TPA: TIGR03435 family protein [Bryobacteraceae bacterium]|nr:TIGR03435 family protein [Bryobacteraceae bacterium]